MNFSSFCGRAGRSLCAAQAGAQLFFTVAATQVIFSAEVAALPHGDPRRELAAELVGACLARLDAAAMAVAALAVALLFIRIRVNQSRAQLLGSKASAPGAGAEPRAAISPLLAGLCALGSAFGTTPAIHAMRLAGETRTARFGAMHGLSSGLLLLEMLLFAWAAIRPEKDAAPAVR